MADPRHCRWSPRLTIFLSAFAGIFILLVLLNARHLGANASLHWDASTCILTTDPMPDRATLEQNRQHIFDMVRESGSTDPTEVTRYFLAPENRGKHAPLETVRRYYSQVSYFLARGAFNLGADLTHSPTGAVLFFQLEAALAMAVSLALLLTYAVTNVPAGTDRVLRLSMIGLVFLALASQPVVLSLSRQMLTETAGFTALVTALMLFHAAIASTRRTWSANLLAAGSAGFCFLTLRARYTLGSDAVVLFPLIVFLDLPLTELRRRPWHFMSMAFTAMGIFIALAAVDIHQYGPFILPWVYDQTLVQSTRLYFHTDPPYEPFWVMIYVNFPLLLLPLVGVICWLFSHPEAVGRWHPAPGWQRRLPAIYAATLLVALIAPMALMARQQVSFQPRHLFTFSAVYVCVLLLALPRITWRWFTAAPLILLCAVTLIANIYSTLGPQRTTMAVPWPKTIAGILRDRHQSGPHPSLLYDLADGYFDWSDNTRVHDYLVVFQILRHTPLPPETNAKSLLIIDSSTPGAGTYGMLVTRFNQPFIWWAADAPSHATERAAIHTALTFGTAVYLIAPQLDPSPGLMTGLTVRPTESVLFTTKLWRVATAGSSAPPSNPKRH